MVCCLSCPGQRRFIIAGQTKAPSQGCRRCTVGAQRESGSRRHSTVSQSVGAVSWSSESVDRTEPLAVINTNAQELIAGNYRK